MYKNILSVKPVSILFALSFLFYFSTSCKKKVPVGEEPIDPPAEETIVEVNVEDTLPHIFINIDNDEEVVEKETYLDAIVEVKGNGESESLNPVSTKIKGRGNSTWGYPKKPYRLKMDNKTSLLGLPAAKNWILLANYQDYTLMTNAVSMKIARLLNMPYTNTIVPVNLTVNGKYRGSYNLTQHIEIAKDRVNVGDDGVILELDSYFDEEFKFKSAHYNLPVMLKDGEIESEEEFAIVREEFQNFEDLVAAPDFPNNNYGQYFDKLQLVNFLIVYSLTSNLEINHPKSVFIHKRKGGKYTMGPVWDFDWGFGYYAESMRYFELGDVPLLNENTEGGTFFSRFLEDPEVVSLYKQQWSLFKQSYMEELLQYIDQYAARITMSKETDFEMWKRGPENYTTANEDMKTYIRNRAGYIDAYVNTL